MTAFAGRPVLAQVAGSLAVQNDYQQYGYSLSARRPVGIAAISYDQPGGLYVNGSALGTINLQDNATLLGLIENAGYARRLTPLLSVDGGVVYTELFQRYGVNGSAQYGEVYAGFAAHGLSAHIYYSPNYLRPEASIVYADWEAAISGPAELSLGMHLGALEYVHSPYRQAATQYDWRLTLSRPIKVVVVRVGISGGGPSPDYYDLRPHDRTALIAGASWAF
jgi:uncharacterized protein (TIGR02001 family)